MPLTPPEIPSGQLVPAEAYNTLRAWVLERTTIRVGPGLQSIQVAGGTYISLMHNPQNQIVGQVQPPGGGDNTALIPFFAQIQQANYVAFHQWRYFFREVRHTTGGGHATPWTVISGGREGDAWNVVEHMNTGNGVEGNGVNVTSMAENFPGFAYKMVPPGCIVIIHPYIPSIVGAEAEYWFCYENAVDGVCE